MTLPTTSIRHAVRVRLLELLTAHPDLAGVQVSLIQPSDDLEAESVWFDAAEGTLTDAAIKPARRVRDDDFIQPLWIVAAKPNQTPEEAEERATAVLAAVEDVLADYATLDGLEGLQWAGERDLVGPDTWRSPTHQGAVSHYRVELALRARYR